MPTRTEDGKTYKKGDYAYTPDDVPSHWKLRIAEYVDGEKRITAAQVGRAIAALTNYRGNKVEIPDDDLPSVRRKLRTLWRQTHPDADPDEMPESIRERKAGAEVVVLGLTHEERRRLVAQAIEEIHKPIESAATYEYPWIQDLGDEVVIYHWKGALWSRTYTIDQTSDPARAILGDPVEVRIAYVRASEAAGYPSAAFLSKLKELIKAAIKDGDLSEEDYQEAVRKARAHAGGLARAERIRDAKAKAEGDRAANDKEMPMDKDRSVCSGEIADLCADGAGARLFLEVRSFVEAPEWLPILPKPGTYKHPVYGEVKITRKRNERFVDNLNKGIYQQEGVPIDAEHETKVSGALGWIREMRLNEDGSADGRVEWTERGKTMLEEDRFRYVSPEWFDSWTDPVDGTVYKDVLIGAALVTRPFFKDKALRSIAQASEGSLLMAEPGSADLTPLTPANTREGVEDMGDKDTTQDTPLQMSEEVARRFSELESKLAAETSAREAAETEAKKAAERIAAMETEARRKRFEDIVLGRQEGTRRFVGDPAKHVGFLMKLATAFGEDSEEVRQYIEDKRAEAERIATSETFKVHGTSGPAPSSAEAQLEAMARKRAEDSAGKLSHAQAYAEVVSEHPELYRKYLSER
ncbi:MAG: phage protease [Sphingomonadaceae bacterium]